MRRTAIDLFLELRNKMIVHFKEPKMLADVLVNHRLDLLRVGACMCSVYNGLKNLGRQRRIPTINGMGMYQGREDVYKYKCKYMCTW